MDSSRSLCRILLLVLFGISLQYQCSASGIDANETALLLVNASEASARKMPDTLFGIFFEEINHAGAGGLWAELISNRGFESGGHKFPSSIEPWSIIGDESSVIVSTDLSSCFDQNKVALQVQVLCDNKGAKICPDGGVGVHNPGFWGMNIEQGKKYKLVFYVRSQESINLLVGLTGSNGLKKLATVVVVAANVSNWTKVEVLLEAEGTDPNSRLELRSTTKGVMWFDQVSLMPLDTYKGHGFRKDLFGMLKALKPAFIRFPGGCFVEGSWLRNAFRWKETIGPWEERPGHFGDVWNYWTDDGLGHFEFLQLAEDLDALPVWVFNNGISHNDQVDTFHVLPLVQEILDGLEFARGDPDSKWGSIRAAMGHPEPFDLRYVAIGNEDCDKTQYHGNYLKFYSAIKEAYPDIEIISNCDASAKALDHPADLYDFHIYDNASTVFSLANHFDGAPRNGPKAFISEYAVHGNDAGKGSLLAALAEAGFLIGVEKNSDAVEMASYAPLFANNNDWTWKADAIVFTSSQAYGTPSYWMQHLFKESNGATLLSSTLQANSSDSLIASAITWRNEIDDNEYLRIKVVNFGSSTVTLKISISGLEQNSFQSFRATKTTLTSTNVMDENSFEDPKKVSPVETMVEKVSENMDVVLLPYSFTSFDLLRKSIGIRTTTTASDLESSF
ncbi:PREDICTED: alpha-L-arabinofuranosidase 1-like [Nicotiana attenuata]|uniref:non-reducing end alpha-L-arabinofuranosidase n=1 Tax=Nicotiana attenuata TaxID=49451 RepID=A0A314L479_NICAT|nr:PREDICTED: alpha-L-arabinofuranosidase 1-like [Nicotiana attenuata]XP_019264548.1 PREDICTED: alpha-L-arabinofuranosidase 1-like [Nicotiana attenuata]OIT36342.1 alpha-l-arabinofuranosidase 1 [Nicotiana attenuata]